MKILDLFAGKGGELRRAEIESLGHEYITMDYDEYFGCDISADIFSLSPDMLREWHGSFDFVWASPPCEGFSVSSIGHHWNKDNTPKTEKAAYSVKLVKRTIWIIEGLNPFAWAMENPRGKLRKLPFMQEFQRWTVTYCQYGENRMKPTDIWGRIPGWNPRPACKAGDPCHISAPRGSRTGTQGMGSYADKSIVPIELWLEILDALENPQPTINQPSLFERRKQHG